MSIKTKFSIPEPPSDMPGNHRAWATAITNVLRQVQGISAPPNQVPTPRITPVGGGNIVDFQRTNGQKYILYHSTSGNIADAGQIDLGLGNRYFDATGTGGVNKTYWVVAQNGGLSALQSPPGAAMSLDPGASATIPDPLPPVTPTRSPITGRPADRGVDLT
jgi:hypothetical protein